MFNIFQPNVPQVTVEDVQKSIETNEKMILLDVRTKEEYDRNRIKGSINLPIDEISKVTEVIPNKSEKIFVYCLSGSRSVIAVKDMVKLGYTNVYDVSHGLMAWRIKQYPLETN